MMSPMKGEKCQKTRDFYHIFLTPLLQLGINLSCERRPMAYCTIRQISPYIRCIKRFYFVVYVVLLLLYCYVVFFQFVIYYY